MKAKFTMRPSYGLLCLMCIALSVLFITGCADEELIIPMDIVDPASAVGDAVSITNPGFESSKTGWSGTFSISNDEYSGSQSAKIDGSSKSFSQVVSVKANTDYDLSAYVLGSWRIGAVVDGSKKTRSGNTSDWKKETVSFTTGSATSITIIGEYKDGTGRFDDFSLIEGGSIDTSGNLALGGTASQSSNYSSSAGLAGNAIDGDTNGNWNAGSVTHTQTGVGQWWKVDLGSTEDIGEIVLYNRTNCCKDRLDNVTVSVENTSGTVLWSKNVASNSVTSLIVDAEGTSGRVIRITQNNNKPLSLAEVEVFAGEAVSACSFGSSAIPSGNLAYGMSTSQSSTYTGTGGESCKAVDGNTSGNWNNQSITHTLSGGEPWWKVYLASNTSVGEIKIFNRTNCCSDRLENFTVSVLNSSGNTQWSQTVSSLSSSSITLDADGATGTTIRIDLDNDGAPLSLAEVQVFEHEDNPGTNELDPNEPPSENFDLSNWKITMSDGDDESTEVLVGGFELSNQFYTNTTDGGMVFKNYPKGAGTTTSSDYSRVEFREMLRGTEDWWDAIYPNDDYPDTQGINGNNWVFSSSSSTNQGNAGGVDGTMTATLKVNSVTESSSNSTQNGRIIIGQIHASGNEPIRLYYHKQPSHQNGAIYYAHEPNTGNERFYNILGSGYVDECDGCDGAGDFEGVGNPSDGIALNEEFSYKIKVVGNLLEVFIYDENGSQIGYDDRDMSNSGFANDWMYFKAGLYSADKSTQDSNDYQQVTFYAIDVTHD